MKESQRATEYLRAEAWRPDAYEEVELDQGSGGGDERDVQPAWRRGVDAGLEEEVEGGGGVASLAEQHDGI